MIIKSDGKGSIEAALFHIIDEWKKGGDLEITCKPVKNTRSTQQNRAMRKGWMIAAEKLNEAGWSQNDVFKIRQSDVPWSPGSFEHSLWRPLQSAFGLPESTTSIDSVELNKIWCYLRDHLIKSTTESDLGPTVDIGPFPSIR